MKIRFSNPYWLWLSLVVIALDQITKQLIINHLQWYDVVPVTNNLNITYLRNTGAAFSSFSQLPPWFFVVLGSGVSIGILVWLRRNLFGQQLVAVAMCLIMGGALACDQATTTPPSRSRANETRLLARRCVGLLLGPPT